jgi:hypothetical protein
MWCHLLRTVFPHNMQWNRPGIYGSSTNLSSYVVRTRPGSKDIASFSHSSAPDIFLIYLDLKKKYSQVFRSTKCNVSSTKCGNTEKEFMLLDYIAATCRLCGFKIHFSNGILSFLKNDVFHDVCDVIMILQINTRTPFTGHISILKHNVIIIYGKLHLIFVKFGITEECSVQNLFHN